MVRPKSQRNSPGSPAVAERDIVEPARLTDLRSAAALGPFSYPALRWLMFNREANGLARAVVKVGRRTYIDMDRFAAWLAAQREVA